MSKKKSVMLMAAFAAMCFLSPSISYSQTNAPQSFKIKTPNTKSQLKEDKSTATPTASAPKEEDETPSGAGQYASSGTPRRLHQHALGLGLGETFLLGKYADYGKDKITADLLYSYAASYSFDLLLNAHMSEHKDNNERIKLMGLTSSIKARLVEYDNFSPFVLGGLGFYAPQAKREVDGKLQWTDQKITFGMNFGGGVDLRLNDEFVVGVLGQLHWPFAVDQDKGSDLKGYYFKLLITGMYLF